MGGEIFFSAAAEMETKLKGAGPTTTRRRNCASLGSRLSLGGMAGTGAGICRSMSKAGRKRQSMLSPAHAQTSQAPTETRILGNNDDIGLPESLPSRVCLGPRVQVPCGQRGIRAVFRRAWPSNIQSGQMREARRLPNSTPASEAARKTPRSHSLLEGVRKEADEQKKIWRRRHMRVFGKNALKCSTYSEKQRLPKYVSPCSAGREDGGFDEARI